MSSDSEQFPIRTDSQGRVESHLSQSHDSYKYDRLPPRHIRVFKLLAGVDTDVEVSLESVSLDDDKGLDTVEALSYT
jgi:hypothetical protein